MISKHRGLFISFEGGEGAGKSTLIHSLYAGLTAAGHDVLVTREPGGCALAEAVRELVLGAASDVAIGQEAELFLFLAARAQHVAEKIRPALDAGRLVLCDRFTDSSVAYQGVARGLGAEHVQELSLAATGGLQPDRTFLLDISPKDGLVRAGRVAQADRMESAGLVFHEQVRSAFLDLAQKHPERIQVLDGMDLAESLFRTTLEAILGMV